MVWPDGTPHPGMFEHKKLAQPLAVNPMNLISGRISIESKQYFTNLSWLKGKWELQVDGKVVQKGVLDQLDIEPGQERSFILPLEKPSILPGQECHLMLRFETVKKEPWVDKGVEIAWEQFTMPTNWGLIQKSTTKIPPKKTPDVTLTKQKHQSKINCQNVQFSIDNRTGQLHAKPDGKSNIIKSGPVLNIWRAATDNDGIKGQVDQELKPLGRWLAWGLNEMTFAHHPPRIARHKDGTVTVKNRTSVHGTDPALIIIHDSAMTFYSAGDVLIDNTVRVPKEMDDLPRLGVSFIVNRGYNQLTWFGRGPHENYRDRNAGSVIGLFQGTVKDQYVPYILPQENGNKTDTRWLILENKTGSGLLITDMQDLEFSVGHLTADDLYKAHHTHELNPKQEVYLNIDIFQRGVGTGACGPDTTHPYIIGSGTYRFSFRMRPFQNRPKDASRFARQKI